LLKYLVPILYFGSNSIKRIVSFLHYIGKCIIENNYTDRTIFSVWRRMPVYLIRGKTNKIWFNMIHLESFLLRHSSRHSSCSRKSQFVDCIKYDDGIKYKIIKSNCNSKSPNPRFRAKDEKKCKYVWVIVFREYNIYTVI